MSTALTELMELLGGAIVTLAEKIAEGIVAMVSGLFLKVDATTGAVTGLGIFGGVVGIFGGVALAIGVTRRVFKFIATLGGSR